MTRLEYTLAAALLRVLGALFDLLPVRSRVVLASPRKAELDGNLLYLERAVRRLRPGVECVSLPEPYRYGLAGKLAYAARLVRGMYLLRTSRLFVVDNAYLPVHVARHSADTTVVQVWHAPGALKRFGLDGRSPLAEPERTFLHRHYDWVVTSSETAREPWSRAFRVPVERVLALGTPRTDFFADGEAMNDARERVVRRYPALAGRRVILYAPTFRGRGRAKDHRGDLDGRRLRAALPASDILVLKTHPNLDPARVAVDGFDVVIDPAMDINDVLAATDVLVTDYSSSVFEYATLRRPLVLLVGDLADYEADPGLYLDYRVDMIGARVVDTDGVIAALAPSATTVDEGAYAGFVERHLGSLDGRASERFVERFVPRSWSVEASGLGAS